MRIVRCPSREQLALDAALAGAERIRQALHKKGEANIILATGMSQAEMLDHLATENLDWSRVTAFHLDEYLGIRATHPASFRKYLQDRFVGKVNLNAFHAIQGEKEPIAEVKRLNRLIRDVDIDVAFVGIGENGHLAFNDPPANVETELPYILVKLDERCRKQQVGEGWFKTIREVPPTAITMSIQQILKSETIICTVPEGRKAEAIRSSVEGDITPEVPASCLQDHARAYIYVDPDSGALLGPSRDPIVHQVAKLEELKKFRASSKHFHLLVAADFSKIKEKTLADFAAKALDAGAVTVTLYGKASSAMELALDTEAVNRGLQTGIAESSEDAILTVSYKIDDLDDALFMFLNTAEAAPSYEKTCTAAVAVVVDSSARKTDLLHGLTHPGEFIDRYVSAEEDEESP